MVVVDEVLACCTIIPVLAGLLSEAPKERLWGEDGPLWLRGSASMLLAGGGFEHSHLHA